MIPRHKVLLWLLYLLSGSALAQIETANGGVTSPESPELKARAVLMRATKGDMTSFELWGSWGLDPRNELRVVVPYVRLSSIYQTLMTGS